MNQAILDPFIESRVEAFESSVAQRPDTRLEDFLPESGHAKYRELLTELIRVDLDLAWQRNQRRSLQQYRDQFPDFFNDQEALEQLTFEEFRQRRQAGDEVEPNEYASSYRVDTKKWTWPAEDTDISPVPDQKGAGISIERTESAAPQVGSRWQGFDLIRELGSGSFGQALLARQTALENREVVLKFSGLESEEAQRLAELQHTNIVPIFSVHAHAGKTVVCMPFLGETTLAGLTDSLSRNGDVPQQGAAICQYLPALNAPGDGEAIDHYRNHSYTDSVLWLVARLADALYHSHKRNVLHCDIKPANIMLRSDGEPMLIDFNLAIQSQRQSQHAAAGGTLPYMAPEQLAALNGRPSTINARSDVYSLGVLLYQLLTGRLPHDAPAARDDLTAWIAGRRRPLAPLARRNAQATPAVAAILGKCLAFEAGERYESARELRDDLRLHLDNQPLRFAPNTSWRESLRKWRLRQPWLFSMSSAIVLCAVCTVVLATAWKIRETRLASDRAAVELGQLAEQAAALRPSLALAALEPRQAVAAVQEAQALVDEYQINQAAGANVDWQYLDEAQRAAWRRESSALCVLIAAIEAVRSQHTDDPNNQQALLDSALDWNRDAARWGGLAVDVVARQRLRLEASHVDAKGKQPPADDGADSNRTVASPDGVDAMLSGLQHLMASSPNMAAREFKRATIRNPTDATNWLMLAEAQMRQREYSRAEASLDVAASLLPNSHLPLGRRGLCRMAQRQYRAAIDDFTRVLELRPDVVEAHLNRGLAYQAVGEHELALADVDAAIAAGCRQTRAHFIRSRLRRALGDVAGAAAAHRQGLSLQPSDEDSWIALGHAKLNVDPEAALEDFQSALEENPLSINALQNIAHVHSEHLDAAEKAIEALSEALSIDASDTMARAGRGVLLARLGNLDAAVADAKVLNEADQLEPIARYQVGCIYALGSGQRPELEAAAISALAESFVADPHLLGIATTDADLDPIRSAPAFAELIGTATEFNRFRETGQTSENQ